MESVISKSLAIPRLGFGTFRMPGDDCQAVVESALEMGYRHIDTAAMYDNEAAVGRAIVTSGIPRKELFVTTKVWHDQLEPSSVLQAFETSASKLGLEYVDLYMVHWPSVSMDMEALMKTMTALRENGRIKEFGVCNFNMPMLRKAIDDLNAPIAAVQVEYHPFLDQTVLLNFLRERNIPLVAYAPLAQGRVSSDPSLMQIGVKHGMTAAQIALAWLLDQDGVIVIPKALGADRQAENLQALEVKLDDDDRRAIALLPKDQRFVQPPFAPDWHAQ